MAGGWVFLRGLSGEKHNLKICHMASTIASAAKCSSTGWTKAGGANTSLSNRCRCRISKFSLCWKVTERARTCCCCFQPLGFEKVASSCQTLLAACWIQFCLSTRTSKAASRCETPAGARWISFVLQTSCKTLKSRE